MSQPCTLYKYISSWTISIHFRKNYQFPTWRPGMSARRTTSFLTPTVRTSALGLMSTDGIHREKNGGVFVGSIYFGWLIYCMTKGFFFWMTVLNKTTGLFCIFSEFHQSTPRKPFRIFLWLFHFWPGFFALLIFAVWLFNAFHFTTWLPGFGPATSPRARPWSASSATAAASSRWPSRSTPWRGWRRVKAMARRAWRSWRRKRSVRGNATVKWSEVREVNEVKSQRGKKNKLTFGI